MGGTARVKAGEGVSYCLIHRRVFLAIHPFSRHRNVPTTSAAPLCVTQGRVTSRHPAERCCRAPNPSEVPVPSLQGSRQWSAADIPREGGTAPTGPASAGHIKGDTAPVRLTQPREHPESRCLTWGHCGVQGSLQQAVLCLVSQGWK